MVGHLEEDMEEVCVRLLRFSLCPLCQSCSV